MNAGWQNDATRFALYLTAAMATRHAFADQPIFDPSSPLPMSRQPTADTVRACLQAMEGTLRWP
jgi:hypothetical protein